MRKIFLKGLLLILIGLYATSLHSQVTIGSGQTPATGALLDLKTETDGTSKLGLGLPRVELTDLKPATNADLAKSIGNATGSYDMAEHIGLIVYNTKAAVWNTATCKTEGAPLGLYVWDGSQWQGLGAKAGGSTGTADPQESETPTTLTDREGNTYAISTFGTAGTWMTENLRTTTAPGLTAMTESAAISTTDMYYAYPMVAGAYVPGQPVGWTPQQGLLYNWPATMNRNTCVTTNQGQVAGTTPGPNEVETTDGFIQGICPFGWHVPSDREWNQLEAEIATKASLYTLSTPDGTWTAAWETATGWRGITHGRSMKTTTPLNGTATNGNSKPSGSGGFDLLLPGGAISGSANNYGNRSYLWSSSSYNSGSAWYRFVIIDNGRVYSFGISRGSLYSVRCKKN